MKIGFSSQTCPDWDLDEIVARASEFGYHGVELHGLGGETYLPGLATLANEAERVRRNFQDHGVELVCLSATASLSSTSKREIDEAKKVIGEFIELAAKLGCPNVRIPTGEIDRFDYQRFSLSRMAAEIAALAQPAAERGVTLLIENGGDFPGSDSLWFIIDVARHPAVQVCWNQCNALVDRERPTVSIPRLGSAIGLVHICDAEYDAQNLLSAYRLPGQGRAEVARQIALLRGVAYDGYLVFDWPNMPATFRPDPNHMLPAVAKFLREHLDVEQEELTAYKGDKRKVKMAPRPSAATPR